MAASVWVGWIALSALALLLTLLLLWRYRIAAQRARRRRRGRDLFTYLEDRGAARGHRPLPPRPDQTRMERRGRGGWQRE